MKRHWEEMSKMREGMEAYHEKRMRDTVQQARDEKLNNGSSGGTNDAVPDLSMPSPMIESFDDKKNRMTGIEFKDNDRE